MKNGFYKSELAAYYIKDNKIMMHMKGQFYKTNENFMQGTYMKPLTETQIKQFDDAYKQCKQW